MITLLKRRFVHAFGHSINGIKAAWRSEEAVRVEIALLAVLAVIALLMPKAGVERALLIGSLFLVLITELLNTAMEKTVDRISTERHDLSKKAKDIGSAAVLIAIIQAIVVWLLILL
jgi:diacylglycerol kinase (ATP)